MWHFKHRPGVTHLGEGDSVKLVLAGKLETDGVAALEGVGGLGTSLNAGVDLLVVASSDNAQVLHTDEGGRERWVLVAEGGAVAGDSSLLDVVTSLGTSDETLVADDSVNDGVDVATGAAVEESASVEVGLLESDVQLLGALAWNIGVEEVLELKLDWLVQEVCELNLGVEQSGGGPTLGDGDAWTRISQVYEVPRKLNIRVFCISASLVWSSDRGTAQIHQV